MASFWNELKRRSVFRVAVAYAVVAWLLIQIIETTFPVLRLPDWSVTLVTVVILIGFPLALIFAWAFEVTPDGVKLDKDVEKSDLVTNFAGRRLDFVIIMVLAIAVAYWTEQMAADADRNISDRKQELLNKELETFVDSFHKRGKRSRSLLWT